MKRDGMKQAGFIVLLGVFLLAGYHFYRQGATDKLSSELRSAREQSTQLQFVELQVREKSQRLSGETDLASFVEGLYGCARNAGVFDHEVTTSKQSGQSQTRRSRKSQRVDAGGGLKTNRLQITLSGDFRSIAEYLRQVQALDRFKQIARLDLTPDKSSLKLLLLLDLYSLKGADES